MDVLTLVIEFFFIKNLMINSLISVTTPISLVLLAELDTENHTTTTGTQEAYHPPHSFSVSQSPNGAGGCTPSSSNGGGGGGGAPSSPDKEVPLILTWDGYPHPPSCLGKGTPPHPDLRRGTPILTLKRGNPTPPILTWGGGTPHQPDEGTPPPHKCGQTENITFPHPSDAGGNNRC